MKKENSVNTTVNEKKTERKPLLESLREWFKSLQLGKPQAVMLASTLVVLVVAFLIFNNLSVSYARRWDIEWGYYAILSTFILLVVGFVVNIPYVARHIRAFLPSGETFCGLAVLMIIFSVFMFANISNTHRVLSDETSWESMGLQMYFQHTGGICNEGVWEDGVLDCKTEVNNFKGKALGFVYSLVFNFMSPDRNTALKVNYPFYLLSLLAFFLALAKWFKNDKLALAATAFLGGMPIYLLQARAASTEVLYICLLAVLMAWYAFVPTNKVTWKHFLLTIPLLGFFAQTRQETVFAFIPFALYYYRYFLEKPYRLPAFVAAVIAVSWPSVNNMAAYRGYDFQGGEHAAHSFENLWYNLKTNLEVMLNMNLFEGPVKMLQDPAFGGIMMNPFYTTFTIILLVATLWLLVRMIISRRYVRGFILGILFCLQIFVIMFNVSGTFTIDINQRYVLVALPLFALLMALGLYDCLLFWGNLVSKSKMRSDAVAAIVMAIAIALSLGLMCYYTPSYKNNMLYYKNKLLGEEDFLNTELAKLPKNSIYIYARPWQMLAQGHSAFSERTFESWSTEEFSSWMQKSGGNIYMVRGQDGYGSVDRTSRVVGFKTTNQIDKILGSYKHERILMEQKRFGYPLVIYKIIAKKGTSFYAKNFTVSEETGGSFILGKQFPESISCDYSLNGEWQSGILFAKTNDANMTEDSLKQAVASRNAEESLVSDTVIVDSSKIRVGINRAIFSCMMPDADTIVQYRDFFVPSDGAELLTSISMGRTFQEWGSPQVNESVEHHQITLDGVPFRFGIGSHANSDIEYNLPRPFDIFHAVIGLDDESACGDGAHFVVVGDDRELLRSRRLYSMEKETIDVDIRGVKKLNLRIEMGGNKDCDHGDWASAWLEAR